MKSSTVPHAGRPRFRAGHRPAFTLMELLMVVGIMALVMSILMPALGTLRATSQQVYCLSNMREVGRATFMYSNAYKELTPLSHVGPDGTGAGAEDHQSYSDLLMRYLKDTVTMDGNKVDLINYETIGIFDCPSTDLRPKSGTLFAGDIDSNNGAEIEYGMNNHGRINNSDPFWTDNYMPTLIHRKRDEVMNHDVVFFAETEGDWDP
ncbi:MAG: prepilin-type N-terminal cleavage/methylation domain-containing protein, partial [Phycisphaerae bacterium]|nr:prepilin-type N-terminal cleavage/methylation domain-containing protein [Phycisphaerae bacterium]